MNSSTTNQRQEAPARHLCTGGCGFYGMGESQGLCSKCYNDHLIQLTTDFEKKLVVVSSSTSCPEEKPISPEAGGAWKPSAAKRTRCGSCKKKVGLLGFACRCGEIFCGMHRLPEAHGRGIDFKKAGRFMIEAENPHVEADKIARRI